jgi:hypothetical protein
MKPLDEAKSIESVMGVNLGIPNSTGIMVFNAENVITAYESEAKEILRRCGYPLTLEELWKRKEELLPDLANGKGLSQIYHIFWMLWNLEAVKSCVEKNDADGSACYMATAIYWATIARLEPVLPTVEIGKKRSAKQKENRGKRKKWGKKTKEEIEERNEKIIAAWKEYKLSKNSLLSKNSFAKKYSKIHKLSITQINTIIKNSK